MDERSLRPLTAGEILQETLRLYVKDWRVYLGVVAAIQIPFGAGSIAYSFSTAIQLPTSADPSALNEILWWLSILSLLAAFNVLLTLSAAYGAVIQAVQTRYSGRVPTFSSAMLFGWRSFFDLLWASLLTGLALGLLSLLIFTCLGAFIALPAMAYAGTRWMYCWQAIIIENLGAVSALHRSWRLVSGLFWRSLGIAALLAAITIGLPSVPTNFLSFLLFVPGMPSSLVLATLLAANAILTAAVTPIYMIGLTVAFYDTRARRAQLADDPSGSG